MTYEEFSLLKPGDTVRIVSDKGLSNRWNCEGLMDKYLDTIMTIRCIVDDGEYASARMLEDMDEGYSAEGGWIWYPGMIECIENSECNPDPEYSDSDILRFLYEALD